MTVEITATGNSIRRGAGLAVGTFGTRPVYEYIINFIGKGMLFML